MAFLPTIPASGLELTISVPGISSSSSPPPPPPSSEGASAMRALDINQVPSTTEEEWLMLGNGDDEEKSGGGPPNKKLRLTKDQYRLLEESFTDNPTLNPRQRETLALQLNLKPRQVEVWFQNRRARTKLKQTEMECEYLKRWLGTLTEENRRLQREVEELRGMKMMSLHGSHQQQQQQQLQPVSTLSMCPRCERVTSMGRRAQSVDKGPATCFFNHPTRSSAAC